MSSSSMGSDFRFHFIGKDFVEFQTKANGLTIRGAVFTVNPEQGDQITGRFWITQVDSRNADIHITETRPKSRRSNTGNPNVVHSPAIGFENAFDVHVTMVRLIPIRSMGKSVGPTSK